ncbi:hypothetical protein NDU88_008341 [Pleurodeles waltl]|uniref:Uncharacterized protein n=1 Tax=Pleurodeles waltl TaxID=8319 RepID=A0AAV7RVG6_PLEWA|nr:hypothetical protein NDU88_008341 [Pleurodeles waltl]
MSGSPGRSPQTLSPLGHPGGCRTVVGHNLRRRRCLVCGVARAEAAWLTVKSCASPSKRTGNTASAGRQPTWGERPEAIGRCVTHRWRSLKGRVCPHLGRQQFWASAALCGPRPALCWMDKEPGTWESSSDLMLRGSAQQLGDWCSHPGTVAWRATGEIHSESDCRTPSPVQALRPA